MTPRTKAKPGGTYHHGDLRQALIEAAREAIDLAGPKTIELKALAIQVGVTQSAPYRHFASREAVLEAVATDGFDRFRAALLAAEGGAASEGAFERSALAYIRFGQANPGVYRLMFASREICGAGPDSPLAKASSAALQDLLQRVGGRAGSGRVRALAMWIWSTLHGIVMLDSEGLLSGPDGKKVKAEEIVHELAEAVRLRLSGAASPRQKGRKKPARRIASRS